MSHPTIILEDGPADLSTMPDGIFVTWRSLEAGRLKRVRGTEEFIEGTPDLVLEVVSHHSVQLEDRLGDPDFTLDVR